MVMALEAKSPSVVENSVVGVEDFLCSEEDDDIDGANACDVLASDAAARSMVLAENSFMVVVMFY